MALRAVEEIAAVAAASTAVLDALTNHGPPRVVLVDRLVLEDYEATLRELRRLERRLRRREAAASRTNPLMIGTDVAATRVTSRRSAQRLRSVRQAEPRPLA